MIAWRLYFCPYRAWDLSPGATQGAAALAPGWGLMGRRPGKVRRGAHGEKYVGRGRERGEGLTHMDDDYSLRQLFLTDGLLKAMRIYDNSDNLYHSEQLAGQALGAQQAENLSHTDPTNLTDASGKGWEGAALGGGSHGCKRNRKGRGRRPGFTKECQMGIPYLISFSLFPTAASLCAGRHSNGEIVFLSVLYVA